MSGSVTIYQGSGTTSGASDSSIQGPFTAYEQLTASGLNTALLYGNKYGGYLDGVTIGNTSPGPGTFTTLFAQAPLSSATGNEVPTVSWVRGYVEGGSGGGGGGSISTDSPVFTGVPTAPTAAAGTNTGQLATCAFVGRFYNTAKTVTRFVAPNGAPGWMTVNSSSVGKVLTKALWDSLNLIGPATNDTYYVDVKFPCQMGGIKVYLPNATSGASITIKILQNNNPVGNTSGYTGSSSTTSSQTITTPINFSVGDVVGFNVSSLSGTPRNLVISPDGNMSNLA